MSLASSNSSSSPLMALTLLRPRRAVGLVAGTCSSLDRDEILWRSVSWRRNEESETLSLAMAAFVAGAVEVEGSEVEREVLASVVGRGAVPVVSVVAEGSVLGALELRLKREKKPPTRPDLRRSIGAVLEVVAPTGSVAVVATPAGSCSAAAATECVSLSPMLERLLLRALEDDELTIAETCLSSSGRRPLWVLCSVPPVVTLVIMSGESVFSSAAPSEVAGISSLRSTSTSLSAS